jgi:ligand-binding sensor domain-containing protein
MVHRKRYTFLVALLLISVGALACIGPRHTSTPPFFKLGDSIDAVAAAPDGTVWVSISEYGDEYGSTPVSRGTGVAHFADNTAHGKKWTAYTTKDGLLSDRAFPIAAAPDGAVWFGTAMGATRFTGATASADNPATWTTYSLEDGLAGDIQAIALAPDGTAWFGCVGGVSRLTRTDDQELWMTYTAEDGLPEDLVAEVAAVNSIAVAPDGVVWVGTDHDGIARFDGEAWITYTEDDGLASNLVNAVDVAPDGTVWVATHSGVSRFTQLETGAAERETWTSYTREHGLAPTGIKSIVAAPDNTVWVAYYGWTYGISHFDGETWVTYTEDDGLPSNTVTSIDMTPNGALWVATKAGTISRFFEGTWTTFTVQDILRR